MKEGGNQPLYMPVFKWKQGEHRGVKPLTSAQKAKMQPLAELPDRPFDWGKDRYTKSWDKHIEDLVNATESHWGTRHDIALDQVIDLEDSLSSNVGTPWEYLFQQMWGAGVRAVPVVTRAASASEIAALIQVSKIHKHSRWLLRYRIDEIGVLPPAAAVQTWLQNTLAALGSKHRDVDVVLDLKYVGDLEPKALAAGCAQLLAAISALGPWRQITLASGGFPKNLAGVPKGTKQIPRRDWELYWRTDARPELAGVEIAYGDYGVSSVEPFTGDPRKMVMSANIRYAHWTDWFVLKGKNTRDYGFDQYKDLCKLLVALPVYMQATFSQGDASYENVATNPKAGPGNATLWRRDATNHHVHVVLHQLANLPEF